MFSAYKNPLPGSIIWFVILLCVSMFYQGEDKTAHNVYTILCLISYFLCIYNWTRCGCKFLSLYSFFVIYLGLSNLGQSILSLFLVPEELLRLYYVVPYGSLVKMLRFQSVCVAALNLGTVVYIHQPSRCISLKEQQNSFQNRNTEASKLDLISDVVLLFSFSYYLVSCFRMIILRQYMDYAEFFEANRGIKGEVVNIFAQYLLIILSIWSVYRKRHIKAILVGLAIISLIMNFVGARGLSFSFLAILLITVPVVYPNFFARKYAIVWAVTFFVLFGFFSVISEQRHSVLGSGITNTSAIGYNFISTVSEMGMSERPATLTIEAVDQGHPKNQSILIALIRSFIPLSSHLPFIELGHYNLSNWITDYAQSFHSGLGYSCIGELYLNYGEVGYIFMLFWGFFIAYAENKAYRDIFLNNNYLFALILLALLCVMVPWARGEFSRANDYWRNGLYLLIINSLFNGKSKYNY